MLWLILLVLLLGATVLVGAAGCFLSGITTPGDESGLIRARMEALIPSKKQMLSDKAVDVSYLMTPEDRIDPSKRPIVYVHGTPGDATNWGRYLRDPVGGRPSYALDRPGFGASLASGALPSFQEQAAALRPLLEAFDQPAILVGHSLGGPIVARAAVDYPELVAALVIAAGSLDPDLEKLKWYNHAVRLPLVGLFLPQAIMHANDEVMAAKAETTELGEVLEQLRCPIVIVHGTEDALVPYANAAYIKSACMNAAAVELITLEGANHFIIWQHVEVMRDAIERADVLAQQVAAQASEP